MESCVCQERVNNLNEYFHERSVVVTWLNMAITLMYCNRLHAWWSTQSRLATLLSFLIARLRVWLQTLRRFRFKDLSIDEMVGA